MGVIRRTASSRKDYIQIWEFIAPHNVAAADMLLLKFDKALQLLSRFPRAGPARSDLRPRLRSFPVGDYIILYRPLRDGIELIRVVHGARDLRKIFRRP